MFREYCYVGDPTPPGPDVNPARNPVQFEVVDPGALVLRKVDERRYRNATQPRVVTLDLDGAVDAELWLEYCNVHVGTTGWFGVNTVTELTELPRPVGTPLPPEHYNFAMSGGRPVPLELADLREGENAFYFVAGPQVYGGFGFGCYWVYDFTVRLYYERGDEHPAVRWINVKDGDVLTDDPMLEVAAIPGASPIRRVDLFALYEGFNVSGSGLAREWHGQRYYGTPRFHVGSAVSPPWEITWDTEWVPDQDKPMRLVAVVADEAGWQAVSPVVENLSLRRGRRRVRMVKASEVPEQFAVKGGQTKECVLQVPELPSRVTRAALMFSSMWADDTVGGLFLNSVKVADRFGKHHDRWVDTLEIDPGLVHEGRNVFSITSDERAHGPEIDWPGPVLMLETR